jgi:pSer/pThr/pTyr-binding forkhead associated (FHA) protein
MTADGATIADLGSTNGTLVNGRPVGPAPVALRPGDRVQVGTVLLELLSEP